MMLVNSDYRDPATRNLIIEAFKSCLGNEPEAPIFVCIGSDRHLLDCLGPMIGTMLQDRLPHLIIYGNLDHPLHARNLIREMISIKNRHPDRKFIAIDAAVGEEEEIGRIQLRPGAILPGRAVAKNLPAVGDYSLTAIVEKRSANRIAGSQTTRGFAHVYHMAKLIQEAITDWYSLYQE